MRLQGRALTLLIALGVMLPIAAGVGMFLRERGAPGRTVTAPPESGFVLSPAPDPAAEAPKELNSVSPALRATVSGGVTPEMTSRARGVPGVGAAARVLLSNLTVETGRGPAEVSVAAVDPDEFRPLTPASTAKADFVWEGLGKAQTFIAHEEFQMFGGQPITSLAARGPGGTHVVEVGGLATNGVPNLAGILISLQQAHLMGLGEPKLLVVGLNRGAKIANVQNGLARVLPGVKFERMGSPGRSFFVGRSAQRAIGSFRFQTNDDGTITQDRAWVARHIVRRRVPILGSVTCHRVMIPQLEGALKEIQDAGLAHLIKPGQYGGCYVPRFVGRDRNRPLSNHAWGMAIDINVSENPLGAKPKMDPRIVAVFEKWGFRWGGRWSTPDGHHFELAALLQG